MKKIVKTLIVLQILVTGMAGFFLTGCKQRNPPVERPNILLITVDTLRADHLGCYGYRLDTSPNMDRLAARGVRFVDCTVQWPKTGPSVSSFLTGEYPQTRGMLLKWSLLPSSVITLAEIFGAAGYDTGAVVSNVLVSKQLGFSQGFGYFAETWNQKKVEKALGGPFSQESGRVKEYLRARIVVDIAVRWLEGRDRERPFFLWLHFMDPHGPYTPPPDYSTLFEGTHPTQPVPLDQLPKYQLQKKEGSDEIIEDLAFYMTQYDREIRNVDTQLGRLFQELGRMGFEKETLTVLTADHGESLDDHGYYLEHGMRPYQACAHVPLIMALEGGLPAGKAIHHPVALIDVSATLVDMTGLPRPDTYEGNSLMGLFRDQKPRPSQKYVFMQSGFILGKLQRTVRSGQWKLTQVLAPEDRQFMTGAEYELYDVYADPKEEKNVAAAHPEVVGEMKKVLDRWHAQRKKVRLTDEERRQIDTDGLEESTIRLLKSLGYIR